MESEGKYLAKLTWSILSCGTTKEWFEYSDALRQRINALESACRVLGCSLEYTETEYEAFEKAISGSEDT